MTPNLTPEVIFPQLTSEAFAALGAPELVYVRPIKARDVLGDTPLESVPGLQLGPDSILYAVHGADGSRLAVLADHASAVAAARAHELAPVSVH